MSDSDGQRSRRSGGDRHGWNSEQEYFNVHHRRLDDLRGHFIERDTLHRIDLPGNQIQIKGRIDCKYGLFLDVDKTLERNSRGQVRTISYSYQACLAGQPVRPIFRYDNAHPHADHQDAHHKHVFNPRTWEEQIPPDWIGRDGWPHLSDVLKELEDWWFEIGQHLDLHSPTDDR